MLKMFAVIMQARSRAAHKFSGAIEHGESVTHFLYGAAIVAEHHWELSFYSLSALTLGVLALLTVLLGHGEQLP
jgi:hypothetical protein